MITGYNWIAWSTCTQVDSFEKFLNDYGRNYNDSYRYIKRTKAHLVEQTEPDQHGQTGETTLCGREIPHVHDRAWWSETEEPTRDKCKLCVGMAERRGLMN